MTRSIEAPILYELRNHVALITLNRPAKLNSLTPDLLNGLNDICTEVQSNDAVRAIILTGAGSKSFSAGGDLQELIPKATSGEFEIIPDPEKRFFSDVYKPIISAINGICFAGGFEMMLGTDIRIAAEHAVFGLREVRVGIIPGAGTHVRLPQQIPWAISMQMLLTGEPITARRAHEVGLVNEIVPADELLTRAFEIAEVISANAPLAVQAAKEAAVRALNNGPAFRLEHDVSQRVGRTNDAKEGPRAFIEKRAPNWTGS